MTKEISGIPLARFEEPIREALIGYEDLSEGRLNLDVDQAAKLELTPDKPNSARSATEVKFDGKPVGTLYVIGFKPEDGTGDEKTFKLEDLENALAYPRHPKIVPRSKKDVHSEGLLTIATNKIEDPNSDPELFKGLYDLLGLDGKLVRRIGQLGYPDAVDVDNFTPLATYTVGYNEQGQRFGDPHSIFNLSPDTVQVCGFLAVTDEVYRNHPEILDSLKTQKPDIH